MATHPSENLHQVRHKACIDDLLNLMVPASRDVGQGPGRLLLDVVLMVAQQSREHGKSASVDHRLGLVICTSDDVSDGTQ